MNHKNVILIIAFTIILSTPLLLQWSARLQLQKDFAYCYNTLQNGFHNTLKADGTNDFKKTKLFNLLIKTIFISETDNKDLKKINKIIKENFDVKNPYIQSFGKTKRKSNVLGFYLNNSASVNFLYSKYANNDKISIMVDINGYKPPNRNYLDVFYFRINSDGKLVICDSMIPNLNYFGAENMFKNLKENND